MSPAATRSRPGQRLIEHDRGLGTRWVAGTDEAGRGALAGPIVAAAVLLEPGLLVGPAAARLARLNDSKLLSPDVREQLLRQVLQAASRVRICCVCAERIDRIGIQRANLGAMEQVLAELDAPGTTLLVDGYELPGLPHARRIVKGDSTSAAIAAAAIVAKVTRDRMMQALAAASGDPYGHAAHKGYGTAEHRERILELGPGPEHRRSFLTKLLAAG